MRLLNIIGTNGSGKSSLLRALAESDSTVALYKTGELTLTVSPRLGVLVVGDYLSPTIKTPGADRIRTKALLLAALDVASNIANAYGYRTIAWEGIMLMTRQYHREYLARGLDPLYVFMDTSLDESFRRIEARSGHTRGALKGNGKIVVSRASTAVRLADWFESQGAEVLRLKGDDVLVVNVARVIRTLGKMTVTA